MSELIAKTENALEAVTQAARALESGDVSTGCRLFGEVKRSGISIIKETGYLLDRVSAVEKYYRELENAKTKRINELYQSEQEAKQKKERKSHELRSAESDLWQAKQDLSSAEEERRSARRRKEEAESSKHANIAGAVGFGIATVLTLGLASPITVPGAVICAVNAADASDVEDRAERDINCASNKISQCNSEISQYRGEIRQLESEIASLSQQIVGVKSERDMIHSRRGEINDAIKHLRDVLNFWKEFSQLTEHGTERATFTQKLSVKLSAILNVNTRYTSMLAQQPQSCVSAWGQVEKKLEKGNEHLFSIDFDCHFCHESFHSLPHLSYGRFCCIGCYSIHS